ncbi:MAG: deoxyhypusine synthase [Nitrososphaerota archaeon]|nr:deoxyhypusine synthase [Candidatus Calditenuaceae archaeon]MDW8072972.1 deoxyhypusine synthase [Nitrososphaerota archaeon]
MSREIRSELLKEASPVRDYSIKPNTTLNELVKRFEESGGFTAAHIADGWRVLKEMVNDSGCLRWLSFVGSITATGLRGVLADVISRGFFKYVVTTCGAIDHDIARSLDYYYRGVFELDDSRLRESGLHRVGSVVMPEENYGFAIERFMAGLLGELYKEGVREIGSIELCREIGKRLPRGSVLRAAADANVDVIVPGIMDGAAGTNLWIFHTTHRDFRLNLFKDYDRLSEVLFKTTRRGALIIGGGISKHHLLWLNQFGGGLDYAVYVTTGVEWDGSLTGAPLREAISWGKLKPSAKKVTIYGDATVILPLLASALES